MLAEQSIRELKDGELDRVGGGFNPFAFTQSEVEIPGVGGPYQREMTMLTTDDYDETIPG
jgi:hypothetical protein